MADGIDLKNPDLFAESATSFAAQLSETVQVAFGPAAADFEAVVSPGKDGVLAAFVRQAGSEGIHLLARGVRLLTMQIRMRLTPDGSFRHLRVVMSKFDVTPFGGTEPLFRYEYDREMEASRFPAAHVQFHGRHPQLEALMAEAGRRRTKSTSKKNRLPNITDLHFPLGGTRFRPCFEDVLEMLIHEFKLEVEDPAAVLQLLAERRAEWRTVQLSSAIRDDMECAAAVLRANGYEVVAPVPPPSVNADRLRRL